MITHLRFISNFHENTVPYRNLAIEEYLLRHVREGECILFLWQNRHTVVIGRNQNAWCECQVNRLEEEGGFLARRLSGGGAVYHDLGNLNFTFLVRAADYDVERQLAVMIDAAASFGIVTEKSGRNDLVIDGHKFSGNAFYRSGDYCFHHGTLMVAVDMNMLTRYLNVSGAKLAGKGVVSVRQRVINLTEYAADMTIDRLAEQLEESFGGIYRLPVEIFSTADLPAEEIDAGEKRFASLSWRLGENQAFTSEIEDRFGWGGLKLSFLVDNGIITRAGVASDGLEADLLASLGGFLEGCPYRAKALANRLAAVPTASYEQSEVVRDAIKLVLTDLR